MKSSLGPIIGVLVLTISTMASLPLHGSVTDPTQTERFCQVMDTMDQMADIVTDARKHIDKSAFDFDTQLDRLDYDADTIVDYVRRSIAFEPYSGTLRGTRGTLLSRAGNSLDQSLLLGKLLNDAGYEARILRTQLDKGTATALLRQMTSPPPLEVPEDQVHALASSLAKLGGDTVSQTDILEKLKTSPNPKNDPHYRKVLKTAEFLRDKLNSAGIEVESTVEEDSALIADSSDYFWVQYRDTVADGWKHAHPAFAGDAPETFPEPMEFIAGTVPTELQHKFRVRLFIERSIGGKLEAVPISDAWERPVANLVDVPLTFSITPNSMTNDLALEGRHTEALANATYFVPLFNDNLAPGGQYFDINGNIVDPMAASGPATGVFATMSDRLGDAVGELGGEPPRLTAQWMELTLISPSGEERTWRRTTLDRIGPAARARGEAPESLQDENPDQALDLLRTNTIMIAAGDTPRQLVLDRSFEQFERAQPMFHQLTEQLAYRAFDEREPPEMTAVNDLPTSWPSHLALFSLFDRADGLDESRRIYRATPGLVVHVQGPRPNGGGFEMVDIVTNARRAVVLDGEVPRLDPQAAVLAGVWDTAQEGELLQSGESRLNTDLAFDEALEDGRNLVVLPPGERVSGVALAPDIEAAVLADLTRGFAVVVPDGQDDPGRAGWWRVNPVTGETVGQAADGRGVEATEYTIKLNLISTAFLSVGMAKCGYDAYNCSDSPTSCVAKAVCCGAWNAVAYALGYSIVSQLGGVAWDVAGLLLPVCGL